MISPVLPQTGSLERKGLACLVTFIEEAQAPRRVSAPIHSRCSSDIYQMNSCNFIQIGFNKTSSPEKFCVITHPLSLTFTILWWEHLSCILLTNFSYTIVLSIVIAMSNIRSLYNWNLYPFTNLSPFYPSPTLGNYFFTLLILFIYFLNSTCKWCHSVFVFFCLT